MLEPCTHPKTKETQIWNSDTDEWETVKQCIICQVIVEPKGKGKRKGKV